MKKCPFCEGEIQNQAVYCKHCNKWLEIDVNINSKINRSRKKWLIAFLLFIPLVVISVYFLFVSLTANENTPDDEYIIHDPNPRIIIHTVTDQQQNSPSQTITTTNAKGIVNLQRLGIGVVNDWVVSSDETTVVLGTSLGLQFFDLQTQSQLEFWEMPFNVQIVALSPDNKLVATGGDEGSVVVWNIAQREMVCFLGGHIGGVEKLSWSPTGNFLASSGKDDRVRLWDINLKNEITTLHADFEYVTDLNWSPDEEYLALKPYDSDFDIPPSIWKVSNGRRVATVNEGYRNHIHYIGGWSPDSAHLLLFGRNRVGLAIYDSNNGKKLYEITTDELGENNVGNAVYVDNNHVKLFLDDDSTLDWYPENGEIKIGDHVDNIAHRTIVLEKLSVILERFTAGFRALSLSPSGEQLVVSDYNGCIYLWDQFSSEELIKFIGDSDAKGSFGDVNDIAWSPDGAVIALAGYRLQIIDSKSGEILHTVQHSENFVNANAITWSPDGTKIAAVGKDGIIQIWDSKVGEQILSIEDLPNYLKDISWSPKDDLIATANYDHEYGSALFNVTDGERIALLPGCSFNGNVAWSPDGQLLAASTKYHNVCIWDKNNLSQLFEIEIQGEQNVVAWSPDGKMLAVGNSEGLHILDSSSGEELLVLDGHNSWVTSVLWARDGTRIFTGSYDGSIIVWGLP